MDIDKADLASYFDLRKMVQDRLKDALVEQYLKKIDLPDIEISPEEVKERMINILAREALNKWPN